MSRGKFGGHLPFVAGFLLAIAVLGGAVPHAVFAGGGLGLPHPDVMNQAGWWGSFDINCRAFAGFSVNSYGVTSLSFFDRFGNRRLSVSMSPVSAGNRWTAFPIPGSKAAAWPPDTALRRPVLRWPSVGQMAGNKPSFRSAGYRLGLVAVP